MIYQFILQEKPHLFTKMEYIITPKQKQKLINHIQKLIDSEMKDLKELADNDELSFGEAMEVTSIEKIKVVDVEKKEGWVISVDIYKNTSRFSFEDTLYHLYYQLKKHIGANEVRENKMVITQNFGPGIDY